jgi:hypothetical protein
MKPIHKLNNGNGATLCHQCRTIINTGRTEDLFCSDICKNEYHTIKVGALAHYPADGYDDEYYCDMGLVYEQPAFITGANWQKERNNHYIVSEEKAQIIRMAVLGVNTTGQCFEQMVTTVIMMLENQQDITCRFLDWVNTNYSIITSTDNTEAHYIGNVLPDIYTTRELFELFKKE